MNVAIRNNRGIIKSADKGGFGYANLRRSSGTDKGQRHSEKERNQEGYQALCVHGQSEAQKIRMVST
jgi:hypothetical protein